MKKLAILFVFGALIPLTTQAQTTCAPGDLFNIDNGKPCPVTQTVITGSNSDLLAIIASLNATITDLRSQIADMKKESKKSDSKGSSTDKKAKEIINKIVDVKNELKVSDATPLNKCYSYNHKRHCRSNTEYRASLFQKIEDLKNDYLVLKGELPL